MNTKKICASVCGIFLVAGIFIWRMGVHPSPAKVDKTQLLGKYAPFHARFSASTGKDASTALQEMLELKEDLQAANNEPLLHAYTLVRIAFLYQATGQIENERKAWQEIESLKTEGPLSSSLALVEENFHHEGSGLSEYIRSRLSL